MPLRHEGKKNGSSPLRGEFGTTCLLKPAEAIENTPQNDNPSPEPLIADGHDPLSLTRNDYKKKNAFRVFPNSVRDGGCLSAMRARSAVVVR